MDLKVYQRKLCFALKKYLNLVSSKCDRFHEKPTEREYLELLREIISIHESQKPLISHMRSIQTSSETDGSPSKDSILSTSSENQQEIERDHEDHPPTTADFTSRSPNPLDAEELCQTNAEGDLSEKDANRSSTLPFGLDNSSENGSQNTTETMEQNEEHISHANEEQMEQEFDHQMFSCEEEDLMEEDIHDLVTAYEFMQSLGLLTIKECNDVLRKRRERHRRNALSHVFCQAVWEKQETKRKKRDWLLSSSPPQLRRKIRNGSQPPSRQTSRPTSPVEGGSSSPTSSLSPPSPGSPGAYNQNSQSEEICPLCNEKGASSQCDGCGTMYHSTCANCPDDENDFFCEWLCSKCELMGLRTSTYSDPLHHKNPKAKMMDFVMEIFCQLPGGLSRSS